MGQEEMLIHFVPCLCVNQPGVGAEVLDFACPEAGLLLQGGKHLKTGTPYPNKQYLVSCRNSGRKKAVSGFLARIPRRLREFTTITRWRLDRGPILTHHVEHLWMNFDPRQADSLRRRQQGGAKATHLARTSRTTTVIQAAMKELEAGGHKATRTAVAAMTGISREHIGRREGILDTSPNKNRKKRQS